jgi:MarR family 2-MHQ and catechol resistance regulon transcriptional repressor
VDLLLKRQYAELTWYYVNVNYIDFNTTDASHRETDSDPMKKTASKPIHVWLVMLKAMEAITRYAARNILEGSGLGDSDFRVLEVLLHKGPLPVNTIGPKVNLTPGSISVAVDRLCGKGLVSRVESSDDRRVRVVALTAAGRALIVPAFQKHAALMKDVFAQLDEAELLQLEASLKKIGVRAQALAEREMAPA